MPRPKTWFGLSPDLQGDTRHHINRVRHHDDLGIRATADSLCDRRNNPRIPERQIKTILSRQALRATRHRAICGPETGERIARRALSCWRLTGWRRRLTSPASRWRRRRAGKGLDRNCCSLPSSASHGREHLFLLVSSFNKQQGLYRRRGYEQVGELKDYCVAGHTELILHKALA